MRSPTQRALDIVVFGATGDTGAAGCACLYFKGKSLGISRWAPAARDLNKLKTEVLDRLSTSAPGEAGVTFSEPIQADVRDHQAMVRMCSSATCVLACAGPYAEYGEGVVRACVEAGTHYVDITGEVPWVAKMERKYGQEAASRGVTMVSMAGYDSVPPDLCAFLAAKALENAGEPLARLDVLVGGGGGAMPTGTINTLCVGVEAAKASALRTASCGVLGRRLPPGGDDEAPGEAAPRLSSSDYVPEQERANLKRNSRWTMMPWYSGLSQRFCLPHFMAPVNIHTVHRTASQEGYGGLQYREGMGGLPHGPLSLYGLLPTVCGMAAGVVIGLFVALPYSTSAIRGLRDKFNPPARESVKRKLFSGFGSTGRTTARAYASSESGRLTASVDLDSEHDVGMGFTMLSACVTASAIATEGPSHSGFQTAVRAVGGQRLADTFKKGGVDVSVKVQRQSQL